jgi:methyltransferase-like protein/2-polyprenyl-3-methyl-5-hydroxy-6-metoxy-1,4-benzoquinol methylase
MNNNLELVLPQNNSYDDIPYNSRPVTETHPCRLGALAALFGMEPCDLKEARVLEIGCANGDNLIPHAVNNPGGQFVGIDLSKVHIDEANKYVSGLELKNIKFHNCSIADVNDDFGKFDYIICHGVFSWVPEYIRTKILTVCSKNLNKNGIAYISYNTMPGWNMHSTLRDLMLYHTKSAVSHDDKIAQSTILLNFIKDYRANSNNSNWYVNFLKKEATKLLTEHKVNYWFHEHLEKHNKAYYFYEFINKVKKHNLQYLSDCYLLSMNLNEQSEAIRIALQWANNIVKTEQYYDFLNNRLFRETLLCHDSIVLNRKIYNYDISKFNMTSNLTPSISLDQIDINDPSQSIKFFHDDDENIFLTASSPIKKAIYYSFSENINNPLDYNELISIANKKLNRDQLNEVKNTFLTDAINLVFRGYINITLQKNGINNVNKNKPCISKFNFYRVHNTASLEVVNIMHQSIVINFFEKTAFKYMDGNNDVTKICDLVLKDFDSKKIVWTDEEKHVYTAEEARKRVEELVDQAINRAVINGLLI